MNDMYENMHENVKYFLNYDFCNEKFENVHIDGVSNDNDCELCFFNEKTKNEINVILEIDEFSIYIDNYKNIIEKFKYDKNNFENKIFELYKKYTY